MDFSANFKPYRNKLSTYDRWSLVEPTIRKLHEVSHQSAEEWGKSGWIPWDLLLFLRLALQYGGTGVPPRVKTATPQQHADMVRRLSDLRTERLQDIFDNGSVVSGGTHPAYFALRSMAFEQLTWQQRINSPYPLGRAIKLFVDADYGRFPYEDNFRKELGLSPIQFMEMYFLLWCCIRGRGWHGIVRPWDYAERGYSVADRVRFIDSLSNTWDGVGDWLKRTDERGVRNPYFQMTEVSPLLARPLLHKGATHWCYAPLLLEIGLENYIYDRLKSSHPEHFADAFGTAFERYVDEALGEHQVHLLRERDLRQMLPAEHKVVDFVVHLDGFVLMIEAKGIEAHPLARVKPDAATRVQKLKAITTATEQFFAVADAISSGLGPIPPTPKENVFGLVVTYKELYLGAAPPVWEDHLKAAVVPRVRDEMSFDPSQMLFSSAHDFDLLLQVVGSDTERLQKIIQKAAKDNANPTTQKQVFRLHLVGESMGPAPERIRGPLEEFWRNVCGRQGIEYQPMFDKSGEIGVV